MASAGPLSVKLQCASWQQLAAIYQRDLKKGLMFLKAGRPPPVGTEDSESDVCTSTLVSETPLR